MKFSKEQFRNYVIEEAKKITASLEESDMDLTEEELRQYVREVILNKYASNNNDILPKEVKQELEKNANKIRAVFVDLLKKIENKDYSDISQINKAIGLLTKWKEKLEKVLN